MRSARGTSLVVVAAMVFSTLALVVVPAGATPAPPPPPPGPVNGSGNFEGTEGVLNEGFGGPPCYFHNTKTIFALRGAGSFAGVTAGGAPVVYKAEIGVNQALYADGPVQIEVESTTEYWHGPSGTFGTDPNACTAANVGTAVPAVARLFAPDHLYRLDGGSNQVPCTGTGSFYRYGGDWHADWSLDADCTVVGNAEGTPGTGAAPQGSLFTDDGDHDPCSDVCTSNIRFDLKQYLAIRGSGVTLVGSTDSAQVGDTVTATARVTNDGVAEAGVIVNFTVAGPDATSPPSGSGTTGADGRATFGFTASTVGNYTVTASAPSATNPGQFVTATLAVEFTPPDPPTIVVSGPTTGYTEENTTFSALFTDARVPVAGATIDFSVTGTGTATPATASAVTEAAGKAKFSFAGARAGNYTVTASTTYNAQPVSGTATVALSITTFYRAGASTLASGENNLTSAVVDPAGAFGYFGTATTPSRVIKVDLGTMARVGAITLASGENNLNSAVIDPAGHYAYFGTNSNPAKVVKIDLTTFSRVGAITLSTGEGNLTSAAVDPAGNFAYFGTAAFNVVGRVVKVDLATFSRVGAITLASDETALQAAVMAPGGGFAYFAARGTSNTGPGRLVRVDLSTFTRVGAVALVGTDENNPTSAVIDPAGVFAYLGTDHYPSRVIKIDLGAMARESSLSIDGHDEGEGPDSADLYSAVMAPDGAHAYFGTTPSSASTPRQVIEIDLATFSRARTVSLPAGEGNLRTAAIAADGAYAYFGTTNSPARVVKVALRRPANPALVAGSDSFTTPYAMPLTVPTPGVLANDVDTGDADPLVAGQASDPPGGSVDLRPDGSFTYTPDLGFAGTDTFTYTASDGVDYSTPATVTVAVGLAPEEVSDVFGGAVGYFTHVGLFGGPREDRGPAPTVSLPLVGGNLSATDPDGAAAIYGPAYIFENHGALDVHTEGTTGLGGSVTSSAKVLNVEDNDPFHAGSPDGEVSSTCTATKDGVGGSTHIVNGHLVTHTDPSTGEVAETVVFDHDYDPAPNTEYSGSLDHVGDHWRIVVNEQILGPDSITVNAVHMYLLGPIARGEMIIGQSRCGVRTADPNAAPVAADDTYTVTQGQPPLEVGGPGVLGNDTDADAQPLTAAKLAGIAPAAQDGDWTFPSDPSHGVLTLNADGSLTYTPDAGYVGPDSFTYLAQDSRGKTDVGTVAITVNSPPVATDDAYGTTANAPLTVAAPGVLTNDTDNDGGTLSATSPSDPPHGSVVLNPDGSLTYTPDAAYVGPDSFTYTVGDGQGGSDQGLVSIAVHAANNAPVATDDTYTTNEDVPLTINAPGVLGNDTDADANPLTASSATDPPNGSVTLNANGSFTYTPDANFNGPDSFDYTVNDGQGGSDTATVTINVGAVNDAPVAGDDSHSANEDTPLTIAAPGVLANDTDAEGPTLTASSATDPPHGTVTLNADGSFTYTPDANYKGPDSFSYTTSDGQGGTDTGTVTIAVASVPDAPVATGDSYSINNGTPLTIAAPGVLANDTDGDGDPLTASAASDPPGGSAVLNANGGFTYNADAPFTGTDTFTYTVSDGTGRTATGTVTITVLPGQASLLKDLKPGSGGANSSGFVQMGGAVYFFSYDPTLQGLWKTDGTEAGTVLVTSMDLSNNGDRLMALGDNLYFTGYDPANGYEFWKSDGTAAGTVLIKDINPGSGSSYPYHITDIGGTLYFAADDGAHGYAELWKSDGTTAGTTMVKDINPGPGSGDPSNFIAVGSTIFFTANDGTHSQELWKTDGSEAGTVLVKDINPGTGNPFIGSLTAFGNTLLLSASNGAGIHNFEPWKSDGTEAGTVMLKEIYPGATGSGPGDFFVLGTSVLFHASDSIHGSELWKTDGTTAGTVMFKDINPTAANLGPTSSSPGPFIPVGNTVIFPAFDGTTAGLHGSELWKTDGTEAGTVMVKDINPVLRSGASSGTADASPHDLVVLGGSAYFVAIDGSHGRELWKSDGTTAGTMLVQDVKPGPLDSLNSSIYSFLTPALGTLFFLADDGIHGEEPWRLTPAPTNPALVAVDDAYSGDQNTPLTVAAPGVLGNDTGAGLSAIKVGAPIHGTVTLNANGSFTYAPAAGYAGADSFSYWASDGTSVSNLATVNLTVVAARARLLKDLVPGPGGSTPYDFEQMGDAAYFYTLDPPARGLWKTDGTQAGTVLLKGFVEVDDLTVMGNHVYLTADDGLSGMELWKSDGTTAGTTMVKDINPGSALSYPFDKVAVNNTLYFPAADGTHGYELWKSDGTTEGTVLVKDIRPGGGDAEPRDFIAYGGSLLFDADDGSHGRELWKTDGTDAGTVMIKDINPGTARSIDIVAVDFTQFGNTVLFAASDGTATGAHGSELWKTDGTSAGTVQVKDITPGTGGSGPSGFTLVGDLVLFKAFTSLGSELWKTDGTDAGTALVKDIRTGTGLNLSAFPNHLVTLGDAVYFSATDGSSVPLHGNELWKSDGTTAGTVLVKDVNPGAASSSPYELVVVGESIYFAATDATRGTELWKTDGTEAGTMLVQDVNPGTAGSNPELPKGPALATLFFGANDGSHGNEPWRLAPGPTPPPAISASPLSVTAGNSVTASWSNIAFPGPTDWVGLYPTSDTLEPGLLSWAYTNGAAAGSLGLAVPANSPPGATYELRLFTNNSYDRLATSAPFSVVASATSIAASPSSVNPGAPVTATFSAIATPTATDWVGLYDSSSAPEPALLNWAYTGGAAAGSVNLFVPGSAPLGTTYELRLFTNNSYTRIATSTPFSVAASTATVAATPAAVNPGAPLTATWGGIAAPTATDWVGLYDSSSTPNPGLLNWAYTNGTAAGSLNLVVPAGAPLGTTYELRLFTNNSYTRLATSAPFSVAASTAVISASPASVANGSPVTATWSGIAAPTATDWVGLYASGTDPDPAIVAWAYTGGAAAGSLNLVVPAGASPGTTYVLRLYSNNSYTRLATSASFSVT